MFAIMLKQFFLTLIAATVFTVASFAQSENSEFRYQLGAGDEIKITVYGEEDLSGEFEIDGTGTVSMPLIGSISVGGRDVNAAETYITGLLADGYLISPRVSIEVLNYRPFYILGEVEKAGSYPYVNGMTVVNAIALASGFSKRANKNKITITRKVNGKEVQTRVDSTSQVFPGDVIRVAERFF